MPDAPQDAGDPDTDTGHKTLADTVDDSLAWNQRLRDATEAYRNTIENLDKTHPRLKPGDVYDAPF